jgi:hypothetical protein
MHLRQVLAVIGIAGLFVVPAAATADAGPVASASGGVH